MRNARTKPRLLKGELATGSEYFYSARPTTDAKDTVRLVSKKAKRKKTKPVAKATKPPVATRLVREKARAANKGSQNSRVKKD